MQTSLQLQWDSCPCSNTLIFSISYTRQEHCETQMLRKRVKELETEYKQLQLEYQVKESRVVDLESDVEVFFFLLYLGMNLWVLSVCESRGPVLGCPQFGHEVLFCCLTCCFWFLCVRLFSFSKKTEWLSSGTLSVLCNPFYFGLQSPYCTVITSICSITVWMFVFFFCLALGV